MAIGQAAGPPRPTTTGRHRLGARHLRPSASRLDEEFPDRTGGPTGPRCRARPPETSISSRLPPAHKPGTHALIIPSSPPGDWGLASPGPGLRPRPARGHGRARLGVRHIRARLGARHIRRACFRSRVVRTCPRENGRGCCCWAVARARAEPTRLLRESSGESFSAARRERVGRGPVAVAPSILRIRSFSVALGEQIPARILSRP